MDFSADEIDRSDVRRRVGKSEEVADLTQFLASHASSYIIGENIFIQGVPQMEEDHEVDTPYRWMSE
jgi:NAD(P)-dependent dehydrogenase (short-subunit alcohol dehydrogenase family)